MVAALILAAGRSSRMGRPKALLKHVPSGRTFVAQLAWTVRRTGVDDIFVIGRPEDATLRAAAGEAGAVFVENPRADEGQLSSLLCGLEAASGPDLDGVLVLPVDVALVTTSVIRKVLEATESSAAVIVRATCGGRHGHPVLFRRAVFDELRSADVELGARAVVRADPSRVVDVEVGDPGITLDIDTPDDYERAFGRRL